MNNKCADQPAHPRSLISTLVILVFKSIISRLAMSKISFFWVVSVAEQAGLNLTLSETRRPVFSEVVMSDTILNKIDVARSN